MHFGKNRGGGGLALLLPKGGNAPDSPITVIPGYIFG